MWSSSTHLLPFAFSYFPQYPDHEYAQSLVCLKPDRPSLTPIQNSTQNYNSAYFSFYVLR